MRYLSLDIETTGLDPDTCDVVQFAAVLDDLADPRPLPELPRFQSYFVQNNYCGQPYALGMHSGIFMKIADSQRRRIEYDGDRDERYMHVSALLAALYNFLTSNGVPAAASGAVRITAAGKNIGMFDLPFMKRKIKDWGGIVFLHRVLDPAVLYYQPGDTSLPDLKTCLDRASIGGTVAHTALEDALDVVKLIRAKLLPGQVPA